MNNTPAASSTPVDEMTAAPTGRLIRQGRLAGRYPAAAAMVIFALVPYLGLSAALQPLTPLIGRQLHMSAQTMSLGLGMANAGYAVGTVLAVQFAQLLPQRRMMVLYATLLVIGSVLAAAAQNSGMFIAGHVLQGLCTSLLLIAAVPPLALGFGLEKFRWTAMIMNVCIFGAVALGPVAGGIQASAHAWRPLFWVVAAISLAALLLSLLTFEDAPPADRDAPRDPVAIGLAASGCVAAFYGASQLVTHRFLGAQTLLPLLGGLALIVVLIVNQYRSRRPLLTIGTMLTSTIPVAGIVVALSAAAASVSATVLTATELAPHYSPLHLGLLYLPELGGAAITAAALGVVLDKRQMQYLPLAGMAFLAAGIAVFRVQVPSTETLTLIGSALTGIGLGAAVAPALFVAGFSLPAASLQRVFAIVELLRAVAAFMIAPVFVHFAATVGASASAGTGIALWIGFGLAIGGAIIAVLLYVLGRARPQTPDLERFMAGEAPAWYSPPLLAGIRNRAPRRSLAEEAA
jgi:MFS family permease